MKLTPNQVELVKAMLRHKPLQIISLWTDKGDRELVAEEMIAFAQKLKIPFTTQDKKAIAEYVRRINK